MIRTLAFICCALCAPVVFAQPTSRPASQPTSQPAKTAPFSEALVEMRAMLEAGRYVAFIDRFAAPHEWAKLPQAERDAIYKGFGADKGPALLKILQGLDPAAGRVEGDLLLFDPPRIRFQLIQGRWYILNH